MFLLAANLADHFNLPLSEGNAADSEEEISHKFVHFELVLDTYCAGSCAEPYADWPMHSTKMFALFGLGGRTSPFIRTANIRHSDARYSSDFILDNRPLPERPVVCMANRRPAPEKRFRFLIFDNFQNQLFQGGERRDKRAASVCAH